MDLVLNIKLSSFEAMSSDRQTNATVISSHVIWLVCSSELAIKLNAKAYLFTLKAVLFVFNLNFGPDGRPLFMHYGLALSFKTSSWYF